MGLDDVPNVAVFVQDVVAAATMIGAAMSRELQARCVRHERKVGSSEISRSPMATIVNHAQAIPITAANRVLHQSQHSPRRLIDLVKRRQLPMIQVASPMPFMALS